jgi:glycerophosphoryl diester phosphodiesterase
VVVAILHANYGNTAAAPVFIQSFEVANLQYLSTQTEIPLVQLLNTASTRPYDFVVSGDSRTYSDLISARGLDGINDYAAGIGPTRDLGAPAPRTSDSDGGRVREPPSTRSAFGRDAARPPIYRRGCG